MTAAKNIAFGPADPPRAPGRAAAARAKSCWTSSGSGASATATPMSSPADSSSASRSRGALAYEPQVLLLDEPFGALDVKIRGQVRRSFRDIQRRLKVTTILVTHDQEEAFEMADRIGVVERGRLVEVGRPEELYFAPGLAVCRHLRRGGDRPRRAVPRGAGGFRRARASGARRGAAR